MLIECMFYRKDLTNKNVNKLEFEEDKSTSEGNLLNPNIT